jgi:hypothetical protein
MHGYRILTQPYQGVKVLTSESYTLFMSRVDLTLYISVDTYRVTLMLNL